MARRSLSVLKPTCLCLLLVTLAFCVLPSISQAQCVLTQADSLTAHGVMDADARAPVELDAVASNELWAIRGIPGEYRNCGLPDCVGTVQIQHYLDDAWIEDLTVTSLDDEPFGWSVAIDYPVAVVGDPRRDHFTGEVIVYRHNGTAWQYEATLTDPGGGSFEEFGYAVAIDGDLLVVGAPGAPVNSTYDAGRVVVFRWNGSTWAHDISLNHADSNRRLGVSVDTDEVMVVAGFGDISGYQWMGWRDDGGWTQTGPTFVWDGPFVAQEIAVAVEGDTLVMGLDQAQDLTYNPGDVTGAVYIFVYSPGPGWQSSHKVMLAELAPGDAFGNTVDLQGGQLLVGAPGGAGTAGKVYFFDHSGSSWNHAATFTASDGAAGKELGTDVAIHSTWALGTGAFGDTGAQKASPTYVLSRDCNLNQVTDRCDINNATSSDVNSNDIPDECETDCNGNSIPDDWDIFIGTSQDCNSNFVPDECDVSAGTSQDCNSNSVPDECDISAGTSQDCNANSVPDECDVSTGTSQDCNSNSVPDECDVSTGTSQDCNSNSVPDECDISAGTSQDCNSNSVPDECDVSTGTSQDCNSNTIPDECDISIGTSEDCNTNSVPDECDVSTGTSQDCNTNTIPDECDISTGTSEDCNTNSVPDECDVSTGTSQDCNTNTIPDECDISTGTSEDCDTNGIPDECDIDPADPDGNGQVAPDMNGNGVPDVCDLAVGDLYVDDDAPNDPGPVDPLVSDPLEDGTTVHPFDFIQEAMDFAVDGQTVWVLPGSYNSADFLGRAVSLRSTEGPDSTTIIGRVFCRSNSTPAMLFEGFHVQPGFQQLLYVNRGSCATSGSGVFAPVIRNCEFVGGMHPYSGIEVCDSSPVLEDCLIEGFGRLDNPVLAGGGLCLDNASPILRRCTIENNFAQNGGGIYQTGGSFLLENCTIRNNTAVNFGGTSGFGGAIFTTGQFSNPPTLSSSLVIDNLAEEDGGGIYTTGVILLGNVTLCRNTALDDGGGLRLVSTDVFLYNSLLWGNEHATGSEGYSAQVHATGSGIVFGGYNFIKGDNWSPGRVASYPLFVDPDAGDYQLQAGSACIDRGTITRLGGYGPQPPISSFDLNGSIRLQDDPLEEDGGRGSPPYLDLGAYEGAVGAAVQASTTSLADGDTLTLNPGGGPDDPTSEPMVTITNQSGADSALVTVTEIPVNLYPDTPGYGAFNFNLQVTTSLPDGSFWMRVSIPFTDGDLGGVDPLTIDLVHFDTDGFWRLAVEENTQVSPGHGVPTGDRFVDQGVTPPPLSTDLGDYGVFWDATALKGFVWANVDHTTAFAGGVPLASTGVDEIPPPMTVVPEKSALGLAIPNPFYQSTTLHFDVSEPSPVLLEVFDVKGRLIRRLVDVGELPAGHHQAAWNGRDENGRRTSAGIFFVRLRIGAASWSTRIIVLPTSR